MKKIKFDKAMFFNIALMIVLLIYSISLLLPIVWGVFASLKTVDEFRTNILGLPNGHVWQWSWGNFPFVLEYFIVPFNTTAGTVEVGLGEMIFNTLMYVLGGAFAATFIPCCVAYLTAKFPNKLSTAVNVTVIVTMVLPIVGAYPSEIQILKALGLYDTFIGSWIQKANFLGMYYLVFFATFKGVSASYSEAAYLDGASEFTVMFRIIFPLVKITFGTVFLIKFIEFWNDYQTPLLYLPQHPTLSFGLYYLTNSPVNGLNNVPMRMTGCIMVMLPIMVLYIIFKDKLIGNISMGGVKE